MAGSRCPAPLLRKSQAEAATPAPATATGSDREEQRRKAKVNMEVGVGCALFCVAVLLGWFCLPKEHLGSVVLAFSLGLPLAALLSAVSLILLSLTMLGRRELVSGVHRFAAKCLLGACAVLSVLTLLSLMALPWRGGVHMYIGLALVAVVVLTATAVHCYLKYCRAIGSDHAAPESNDDDDDKYKEELEAAWKITSSVTNSAFGGLIGVLSNVSKITGAAAVNSEVKAASYTAVFFMFATAIVGVFVMTVSKKMREITRPRLRHLLATTITLANAFLLCTLACAAFAAAFVVLRYRIFAAFAPLVITAILCLLLRYCIARRGRGAGEADDHQERIKAIEDLASKVTMATFAGIMTVLGASMGEKESRTRGAVMLLLTSAFVCGLGFMLIAAAPASTRALLAPATEVLEWSSVSLFAATAVAVYAVAVGKL